MGLPKHFLFHWGKTSSYWKMTSYSVQLQGTVWGSCLVEKGRETTPDASAKNSRKQDCNKLGQTSCGWLCDLQSAPSKLDSKPCGTMFTSEDMSCQKEPCSIFLAGPGAPSSSWVSHTAWHRNAHAQASLSFLCGWTIVLMHALLIGGKAGCS